MPLTRGERALIVSLGGHWGLTEPEIKTLVRFVGRMKHGARSGLLRRPTPADDDGDGEEDDD